MRIMISNHEPGDTVSTPLVILRGEVEFDSENRAVTVATTVFNQCYPDGQTISSPLISDKFTALCPLEEGANMIKFIVNDASCPTTSSMMDYDAAASNEYSMELFYELSKCPIQIQPIIAYCSDMSETELDFEPTIKKIKLGLQIVQSYYSELLAENMCSRKTFTFLPEHSKIQIPFQLTISKDELSQLNTNVIFQRLGKELLMRRKVQDYLEYKYIVFIANQWSNSGHVKEDKGHIPSACDVALGCYGLALMPLSFTESWPSEVSEVFSVIQDENIKLDNYFRFLGDDCSVRKLYSASMGCLAHEIGHMFELGHTISGLMGSDYHKFTRCLYSQITPPITAENRKRKVVKPKVYAPSGRKLLDEAKLSLPAMALLSFNPGFQHNPLPLQPAGVELSDYYVLTSPNGIGAFEIRDSNTGRVLFGRLFLDVRSKKYPLTQGLLPPEYSTSTVVLVVADRMANSLTREIEVSNLPKTSFTAVQRGKIGPARRSPSKRPSRLQIRARLFSNEDEDDDDLIAANDD